MDNPYQSPSSASPTELTADGSSKNPIALRLAILAAGAIPFLVLLWHSGEIGELLRTGGISLFGAAGLYLFALLLALSGALLFFSRRSALWPLLACLPYPLYGVATAADRPSQLFGILSLVCIAACLAYYWRLKRGA
ncbi:hypothetical protein ACPA5B_18820 [Pseudomonas solani]|uniref:hypothetical protein n=1 Tax=Pseudomonas solani TaxID=2731552 RepID=UPI003C2CABAA